MNKLTEILKEEAPIYKDWDEFVNPDYIIVHLKNGKKLKIQKSIVKGGKNMYLAILKAFNDNNYKITNKIVGAMVNKLEEKWSAKYKKSINCSNPKGFSQKAHCAGKKKTESMTIEEKIELFLEKNCPTDSAKWAASKAAAKKKFDVYPSAYANGWAAKNYKSKGGGWKVCKEGVVNRELCEDCWSGYKQVGMKTKGGRQVPNCVPIGEDINSDDDVNYGLVEPVEYDVEDEDMIDFISFMRAYTKTLKEGCSCLMEAEYQGREVTLGKPMQGDVKKFKVYVKNPEGNVVKVNFGQKGMVIKKNNPSRRKSFRARMNCDEPGPRHKARYWSCRKW